MNKFGLSPTQYTYILETVVLPLEKLGAQIYVYGSRARGDHRPFSDLDLMVEISNNLSKEIGLIQEQLENSNFPYKVDLVLLSEFATSYKSSYEKDKTPFR